MGKLNLLHHKSWHVYSQANRDLVKKDEEKERKRLEKEAKRTEEAEQQAKRQLLLTRANVPVENPSEKHVNLFEELEKYKDSEVTKTEDEIKHQQRCDQHTWFLGETRDGKKEGVLWYASDKKDYGREDKIKAEDAAIVKKKSKRDERRKEREDPLQAMKAYLSAKDTGGSSQDLVGKAKRVGGTGVKTVEQLRQERIEREAKEKQRLAELLDPRGKGRKHLEKDYFNSQFNPNLVKQTKQKF